MTISSYNKFDRLPDGYLDLYISAFPEAERRNWKTTGDAEQFIRDNNDLHVLLAFHDTTDPATGDLGQSFIGFLNYWQLTPGAFYGEHLAILPQYRNKGIGAQLIDRLKQTSCNRVILEVEPPTDTLTRRRIEMYRRHGFIPRPEIDYIQPSYGPGKEPLPLLLMTSPDLQPTPELISRLHTLVYGA